MGRKPQEKSPIKKIPKRAKEKINKKKIVIKKTAGKVKYAFCNGGYDLLENIFVVRHYICKRYNIRFRILEILLKLYPMNYFTYQDYFELPKNFQLNSVRYLLSIGLIHEYKNGNTRVNSVFCLTAKGKHIVENFYKYLSGELKIPEIKRSNPLADKNVSQLDKLRYNFIKKMNQQDPSESKKKFYE